MIDEIPYTDVKTLFGVTKKSWEKLRPEQSWDDSWGGASGDIRWYSNSDQYALTIFAVGRRVDIEINKAGNNRRFSSSVWLNNMGDFNSFLKYTDKIKLRGVWMAPNIAINQSEIGLEELTETISTFFQSVLAS